MSCAASRLLIFVEQFVYPDGWGGAEIPRDICVALAGAGFAVEVICGADQYVPAPVDESKDPARAGVRIRRIPSLRSGDIRKSKLLRQLWFCIAAVPLLVVRKPVAFVCQTNPPLIVPLLAFIARLKRVPFLIIAQDLYPETLLASGMLRADSFAGRALTRLFAWAYKSAATVVVLGETMRRQALAKGIRAEALVTISNWATGALDIVRGEANSLRRAWRVEGRFVILYSGNLGLGHEFETTLQAIRQMKDEFPQILLLVVGQGSRLEVTRERARQLGLDKHVSFQAPVLGSQLPLTFGLADLALVTLQPGFEGLVVPSKVLGYMGRGLPLAYVGPPGDVSELISAAGCGFDCPNGAPDALAAMLRRVLQDPSQLERWSEASLRYYRAELSRQAGLARHVQAARALLDRR